MTKYLFEDTKQKYYIFFNTNIFSNVNVELETQRYGRELIEIDDLLVSQTDLDSCSKSELLVKSILRSKRQVQLVVEFALNDNSVGELVLSTDGGRGVQSASLVLNFKSDLSGSVMEVSSSSSDGANIDFITLRVGFVLHIQFVFGVLNTSKKVVSQEIKSGQID